LIARNELQRQSPFLGPFMVQYLLLGLPKRGLDSHSCRVVTISYQKIVYCHGRGHLRQCDASGEALKDDGRSLIPKLSCQKVMVPKNANSSSKPGFCTISACLTLLIMISKGDGGRPAIGGSVPTYEAIKRIADLLSGINCFAQRFSPCSKKISAKQTSPGSLVLAVVGSTVVPGVGGTFDGLVGGPGRVWLQNCRGGESAGR
jgi:hypothetical protein